LPCTQLIKVKKRTELNSQNLNETAPPSARLLHPPLPSPTIYNVLRWRGILITFKGKCGRYRRTTQEEELARLYHIPIPKQTDLPINYNITQPG